jgi:hypothetical protein
MEQPTFLPHLKSSGLGVTSVICLCDILYSEQKLPWLTLAGRKSSYGTLDITPTEASKRSRKLSQKISTSRVSHFEQFIVVICFYFRISKLNHYILAKQGKSCSPRPRIYLGEETKGFDGRLTRKVYSLFNLKCAPASGLMRSGNLVTDTAWVLASWIWPAFLSSCAPKHLKSSQQLENRFQWSNSAARASSRASPIFSLFMGM